MCALCRIDCCGALLQRRARVVKSARTTMAASSAAQVRQRCRARMGCTVSPPLPLETVAGDAKHSWIRCVVVVLCLLVPSVASSSHLREFLSFFFFLSLPRFLGTRAGCVTRLREHPVLESSALASFARSFWVYLSVLLHRRASQNTRRRLLRAASFASA